MPGPTVSKALLGRAVRTYRDARGLSQSQVARGIGCSPGKIHYIETGRNAPDEPTFTALARFFGITGGDLTELNTLRVQGKQPAWFASMKVGERFGTYLGLETEAETVRCFLPVAVLPGLLQTEDYARWLRSSDDDTRDDLFVQVRMHRQQRLTDPDPVRVSAVITQDALTRCLYTPGVAAEQFDHLIELGLLPNVDLRILHDEAGLCPIVSGFTLLTFLQEALPEQAWVESETGGDVVRDPVEVARLATIFNGLRGQALGPNESLTKITEFAAQQHPL